MSKPIGMVGHLFERELRGLKREIELYPDDASVWATPPGIANSAGTVALHCAGSIQHFIGARLGSSGYVRDRNAEFTRRAVPRAEIMAELDRAIDAVRHTLSTLTDDELPIVFPDRFAGKPVRTDVTLAHFAVHLGYHLGQVDYHRRLTTGDTRTLDLVAGAELPEADIISS